MKKLLLIICLLFIASTAHAEYRVCYTFSDMIPVGCPMPDPVPDEFGRIYQDAYVTRTLAMCYDTVHHYKERWFDSLVEAEAFVERAKKEQDLHGFTIEEVE